MKKTYSYKDCFKILRVESNCSWAELRQSYKKSIQKWHPDRFEDGSKEKGIAEDKIKLINIAYTHLQKYYRKNGSLPQIKLKPTTQAAPLKRKDKPTAPKSTDKPSELKDTQKSKINSQPANKARIYTSSALILFIGSLYYIYPNNTLYLNPPTSNQIHSIESFNTSNTSLRNTIETQATTPPEKENLNKPQDHLLIKKDYFTNGSSIPDVIDVMGPPSKTDGDIWFYGESEVHFNEGKVTHWVRDNNNPLKAQIIFN